MGYNYDLNAAHAILCVDVYAPIRTQAHVLEK